MTPHDAAHPTVTVKHHGVEVEVDAAVAPLIHELLRRGIETSGSCEGGWDELGRAYIQFPSVGHALRFLELVARRGDHDPRSLSRRMLGGMYHPPGAISPEELWNVAAWPEAEGGPYGGRSGVRFDFGVEVAFPPSDIDEVIRRVTESSSAKPKSTIRRWEGGCEDGTVAAVLRFGGVEVVACGHADGTFHAWHGATMSASERSRAIGGAVAAPLAALVEGVLGERRAGTPRLSQSPPPRRRRYRR